MNKILIIIAILVIIGLIIWIAISWYVHTSIETPEYTVLETTGSYEIRQYESYIVAQTTINSTDPSKARNEGFRVIADYIFGNNITSDKISMTAPVLDSTDSQRASQNISMTAPVLDSATDSSHTIAFVMPSKFTLDTLPQPVSDKVTIRQVDSHIVAVRTYSWYPSESRDKQQTSALKTALEQAGIETSGAHQMAYYNAPFSFPLFFRNEVMVPIIYTQN